jgi:hypothetical protein
MTTRDDIAVDTLAEEIVFFCKKCGRPFTGMPEPEIQERKASGTFDEESKQIIEGHLRNCRRGDVQIVPSWKSGYWGLPVLPAVRLGD